MTTQLCKTRSVKTNFFRCGLFPLCAAMSYGMLPLRGAPPTLVWLNILYLRIMVLRMITCDTLVKNWGRGQIGLILLYLNRFQKLIRQLTKEIKYGHIRQPRQR